MTGPEIGGWDRRHAGTPRLVIRTTAPATEALDACAAGLQRERFKVKDRSAGQFRARFVDWLDVASGVLNQTTIEARADTGGTEAQVVLTVVAGEEYRRAPRRAALGLTSAVQELRRRGYDATPGAWELV